MSSNLSYEKDQESHSSNASHEAHGHHDHEMEVRDKNLYGFWIYLMTDCILFGSLFLVFLVLGLRYTPEPFAMGGVFAETIILLTSSFTFGLAVLNMYRSNRSAVFLWLIITMILGISFLYLEMKEFIEMFHEGLGFTTHAFYSAFFVLVGTHGFHVLIGLLWMLSLLIQIYMHGITPRTTTKLLLLSLFWHFLDIIWILVFSVVYLIGGL